MLDGGDLKAHGIAAHIHNCEMVRHRRFIPQIS
jgi:hypothetical protein